MTLPVAPRRHVLTVALEDYFQVGAFNQLIQRGQWYRFETRLEKNTERSLQLLDRYGIKATFFVLGWVAEHYPELIRRVADKGHEIASKGYYHRSVAHLTRNELRDDLARAREALERASGTHVLGYRISDGWFTPKDLWALDVLAEEGYAYDSSLAPRRREFADEPRRRFLHQHTSAAGKSLWELPISTLRLWRWTLPIGGGNYFRQFPHWLMSRAVRRWDRSYDVPFVMYYHVWELDAEQPKISSASWLTRVRHYRNQHKMQGILEHYFRHYSFTSAANYLGLASEIRNPKSEIRNEGSTIVLSDPDITLPLAATGVDRTPLTVVIPCYNEELILPYLSNTLKSVRKKLADRFDLSFVFVNDGSKDGTAEALLRIFGGWPDCKIVHHEVNRGVAAAILTGIRNAPTELVASIDCDCTYDPHELARLVSHLSDDVDAVTASPYHPLGQVSNVPGWRLFLSKSSSWMYRRVLPQKLFTYTSCFRLYRKSKVLQLDVKETGFLGVAEILGKMLLNGSRVAEMPATLEVRMLGRSKMKTVRTILGHLKLMARLLYLRLTGQGRVVEKTDPQSVQGVAP